ncbi:MAG TPA: D-alanyl-D-alanine carboxypeptidase/D-alanyl-D-alanine-endopeptidase, partial [Cytophagales bacterium]|nr:D-alanyl-D-alanine carboxypeptidase/D-alanyl-D-alanine-endopeptidase [Cytophagales bacterium]
SGYIRSHKGRVLIFSFMNNNFLVNANDVRKRMEQILFTIYNKY